MTFVRRRGNSHTLIEGYRVGGKVRQRIVANLGPYPSVQEAIKADPEKFHHLAEPVVSSVESDGSLRRGQPTPAEFERRVQAEVEKRLAAMAAAAPPPPAEKTLVDEPAGVGLGKALRLLAEARDMRSAARKTRRQAQETRPLKGKKPKQRGET